MGFNGLGMSLGNLSRLSDARSRSICAENPTGGKGMGGMAEEGVSSASARDLGKGWKVNPYLKVPAESVRLMGEIEGSGAISHIWITVSPELWRSLILRFYWDGEEQPSIEAPVGDFFFNGWCERSQVSSLAVAVNPAGGMNCYWEMPFRKGARITVENLSDKDAVFFYQIDYTLTDVPDDAAYLHTQFRRSNPLKLKEVHTILDGVKGQGHYVGTYAAWGVNNNGWWGEGEIKFYMDGDGEFPTICGTGTEDYFGGAWNFEWPKGEYGQHTNIYTGLNQVIKPDGLYRSQQRFSMYRLHIMDPIRFREDLRVSIQALGWRADGRYLPLQDDISTLAFFYQAEPHLPGAALPDRDALAVV